MRADATEDWRSLETHADGSCEFASVVGQEVDLAITTSSKLVLPGLSRIVSKALARCARFPSHFGYELVVNGHHIDGLQRTTSSEGPS